jgi:transcriptional regulator with XRE-family HTH domain
MVNTNKLKGRIISEGFNSKEVAGALKIALPTLSQKLNNKRPWYLTEVEALAKLLNIKAEEFTNYFFVNYVA